MSELLHHIQGKDSYLKVFDDHVVIYNDLLEQEKDIHYFDLISVFNKDAKALFFQVPGALDNLEFHSKGKEQAAINQAYSYISEILKNKPQRPEPTSRYYSTEDQTLIREYNGSRAMLKMYDNRCVIYDQKSSPKTLFYMDILSIENSVPFAMWAGYLLFHSTSKEKAIELSYKRHEIASIKELEVYLKEYIHSFKTNYMYGNSDYVDEDIAVAVAIPEEEDIAVAVAISEEEDVAVAIPAEEDIPEAKAIPTEELIKLKELLDMGIITQQEFDMKKKQMLGL